MRNKNRLNNYFLRSFRQTARNIAKLFTMESSEPLYVQHRIRVFDKLFNQALESKKKEGIEIVWNKTGQRLTGISFETSPESIAKSLGLKDVIIAKVNDQMWDLGRPLEAACNIEFYNFQDSEGKKVFWHSSAHVVGQALENIFGGDLCTGPPTEEGFYYDMDMGDKTLSDSDLEKISSISVQVLQENQPFQRLLLTKSDALAMFQYNPKKIELISKKVPDGGVCTVYRCGKLIDLCKGPHVLSTGIIKAIKAVKCSGAYWLGNQSNDTLQRVYGISFPEEKLLQEWELNQSEIVARDHRNIGRYQNLFFMHPWSPGSVFFEPHGTRIYNRLLEFLRDEYWNRGFTEVISPNVYNVELWQTSGHWDNYRENMFSLEIDKQQFALKPMNCPGHCLMFAQKARSYRELPIRFADFGVLHRNEFKGALSGLTRVRRFQQDDAHIFCSQGSIKEEIAGCLDFVQHVYGLFGFNFSLELSTRPEKYMGELEQWNQAEKALQEALTLFGKEWKLNPGDGAFYGPKIDIHIKDALGRSHQCATIQLDFQLPQRFNLQFQTEGGREAPVIIHRAILGSVERMFAILIEHTAGKWPFWISPRQCVVLPVSGEVLDYAQQVKKRIHSAKFYVDIDDSDSSLAKKIRDAQVAQYNFILVVGKREQESGLVNVRIRDSSLQESKSVDSLLESFNALRTQFK